MPRYIIERSIPDLGQMSAQELQAVARQSNGVLAEMPPAIQWVHSYVTDDRLYCTYIAPSADLILEHARRGGFPADSVMTVHTIIDPTTGEG
ncbi:MAG: DUF4242 domain-containing protein [Anaerolineaceae bacterium]|nr:DUF4242 domain-containing protein [Anaerolineaceae bacterium]